MAYDGSIRIDSRIDATGATKGAAKITQGIKGIAAGLGVVKAVSAAFGLLKSSISSAFDRADTMEQFDRTMTTMTGDATAVAGALEDLKGVTKGTAYGLDVAAKAAQGFVTRGLGIGDATQKVGVWADAVAFYGKGTNEQLQNVTDALSKMITKGKVEMDQLDRLFDAGIDAVGMYAKATGRSSAEVQADLSNGKISAQTFVDTVTDAMENGTNGVQKITGAAKEAGTSWQGTFDNIRAAATRGMLGLIEAVDQALEGINLPTLKEMVAGIGTAFENTLGAISGKIGPVIQELGPPLLAALDTAKQAFAGVIPAVKEIAGAVYNFVKSAVQSLSSGGLKQAIQTLGNLFTSLAKVAANIAKAVLPILSKALDFCGRKLKVIIPLVTGVVTGMKAMKIANTVAGWVKKVRTAWETAALQLHLFTAAQGKEALASAASTAALNIKEITVGVLTGKIKLTTAAQWLWNAAMEANPVGAVTILVAGLATVLGTLLTALSNNTTAAKNLMPVFETIGTAASDFVQGLDNAESRLDGFNDTLFATSEEQQALQENMQQVQSGITAICQTATKERRDYTAEEIKQLDEYFQKLRELNQKQFEIAAAKTDAIKQQALMEAQTYQGSLAEYKMTAQEWIKTAKEQRDEQVKLINEQTTNELVILKQRYGDQANMQNAAYAEEYNRLEAQKQSRLAAANASLSEITAAYANGYAERAGLADLDKQRVGKDNESLESESERHAKRLKEIGDMANIDESMRSELYRQENVKHNQTMTRIWNELTQGMSDEQKDQLGVLMGMAAQTDLYSGKLDDKTQATVDSIINGYDRLPKETQEAMKNAMQPMLGEMEKSEPSLFDKAKSIADGILNRLRKAFDIHSPSRKMREIAAYLWKGFTVETDAERPKLLRSIGDLAGEILGAARQMCKPIEEAVPVSLDLSGVDAAQAVASLRGAVAAQQARLSANVTATTTQQMLNRVDGLAIAQACRTGCSEADLQVECETTVQSVLDGKELGRSLAPYSDKESGTRSNQGGRTQCS